MICHLQFWKMVHLVSLLYIYNVVNKRYSTYYILSNYMYQNVYKFNFTKHSRVEGFCLFLFFPNIEKITPVILVPCTITHHLRKSPLHFFFFSSLGNFLFYLIYSSPNTLPMSSLPAVIKAYITNAWSPSLLTR